MYELNDFYSVKISVTSPERIRELSYGEVTKPETINYRTQKPEKDGLFCESIFGPMKDWECRCGKYKRIRYKGVVCEKCGVEVTRAKVRRERMGHIELATPVSHIWYLRGVPSRIGLVLDMSPKALEKVIYFAAYVVLDNGDLPELEVKQVLSDGELTDLEKRYEDRGGLAKMGVRTGMGAEAIRELLTRVDLDKECAECKEILEHSSSSQKRTKAVKRLEVLEAFHKNGTKPEWLVLTVLPVLPPELRPMVQLDGGRFASSDLNDLYRRVINRNNRLKKTIELNAPDMIIKNEKRMLQEAVDALLDNGKHGKPLSGPSNREYRSLASMLRGKQGRFRQNLLGKRVDYSGRSVIVVGPELKLYQCGLPKEMAIELFKPFVMKRLIEKGEAQNIKGAKRLVESAKPVVWDVLEEVIKEHPVLLNRAPTLHRLSIQAFEPILIEGRAIKIHPLVCTAFNADFDGDQMAVHVPLSVEAQAEARFLMLSSNNILKLSDGKPVLQPSQDMVMGSYYLTMVRREDGKYYTRKKPSQNDGEKKESSERYYECGKDDEGAEKYEAHAYISEDEALMAYQLKLIHMQDEIKVRRYADFEGERVSDLVKTTVGYIIFNREIPQDLGFVDRKKRDEVTKYEISSDALTEKDVAVGKKKLAQIVDRCFKTGGAAKAADVLDKIKTLGYKYSTIGAITTSVFDMEIPEAKYTICKETEDKVQSIEKKYQRGLMREEERYSAVIDAWDDATDAVTDNLKKSLDKFNPIWMMANSGARGSIDQMKQLSGMRGLMVNPQGRKIEVPVKSCFREGLSVLEYFISSHGGRKGLADTALKTADSGYLTRRLVDVSQDVIVREDDCMEGGKPKGLEVEAIKDDNGEIIEKLYDRIQGRFTCDEVRDEAGNLLAGQNTFINDDLAQKIVDAGIKKVPIRSVFTCQSRYGVCAKCYGKNMSTNTPVQTGEAVGVIAAQSIGEPGTQLTMRTFHTGGIAATGDITQG
ncbi:MAG: DNA-directed RNA polymerase subunit beta', partial [Clostridia bacterium]|nr:DNA-directed RNA polymerase subunit beta' [Clostridia bacterium]